MAIKEITARLPEKILAELDRLATRKKLDRDAMLTRLVESHLRTDFIIPGERITSQPPYQRDPD